VLAAIVNYNLVLGRKMRTLLHETMQTIAQSGPGASAALPNTQDVLQSDYRVISEVLQRVTELEREAQREQAGKREKAAPKPLSPEQMAAAEQRAMDCIDCHNRPTHIYLAPDDALDKEFLAGRLDLGLPRLKKLGMELLTAEYASKDEALRIIPLKVREFYGENYPEVHERFRASVERAGEAIRDVYAANIFPSMNITWNTYPNQIGHRDGGGCFRCHAGEHFDDRACGSRLVGHGLHALVRHRIEGRLVEPLGERQLEGPLDDRELRGLARDVLQEDDVLTHQRGFHGCLRGSSTAADAASRRRANVLPHGEADPGGQEAP